MRPLLILKMRVLMQMYRCKAKAQHAAPGASATLARRHDHSSCSATQPTAANTFKELQSSNEKMEAMNPFSVHFIGYPLAWSDFGRFGPFGRGGTPN